MTHASPRPVPDKAMRFTLPLAVVLVVSAGALLAISFRLRALPSDGCQITFPAPVCPAQKQFKLAESSLKFMDNYDNAGQNEQRCYSRAEDYYRWCSFNEPVRARYFVRWRKKGEVSYPFGG